MNRVRTEYDNLVWEVNEAAVERNQKKAITKPTIRAVEALVERIYQKTVQVVLPVHVGGYNTVYRLRFNDKEYPDVVLRRPMNSMSQFPDEKMNKESDTTEYIGLFTGLLTPHILDHGTDEKLGPFILMQYIDKKKDLGEAAGLPGHNPFESPMLNRDLPYNTILKIYGKMAWCLLQLSKPKFDRIGSINKITLKPAHFTVAGRPVTQNMNTMVQLGNIPRKALPDDRTFETADEYYMVLADLHMAQMVFQHNDMFTSEDDARNKYVTRMIFYNLARQGCLSTFGFKQDYWSAQSLSNPDTGNMPDGTKDFRIWGDDFRPSNVLLDEKDKIAGVVDFEYFYTAPTQFLLDPPWWLLLKTPEMWSTGLDDFQRCFDICMKTWLEALQVVEGVNMPPCLPFSLYDAHRQSWKTGRFWLNYAARKTWVFDTIYWRHLDERFFGPRPQGVPTQQFWMTRLHLLTPIQRERMEPFIARKMLESQNKSMVEWGEKDIEARMADIRLY